jgi:NAD(P)H-hydrate epimerase
MTAAPHTVSDRLPYALYRAAQVRELDRLAIEEQGIAGGELMARAGQAAFAVLCHRWPRARRVAVLCGIGNNGGDGFVVARLAQTAGYTVQVWQVGDGTRLKGDALAARQAMEAAGICAQPYDAADLSTAEVLVDALLGTGLSGEVSGEWRDAIEAINRAHAAGSAVLALDIPSGLSADSGAVLGTAVEADACVSFIGMKLGLLTGQGPDHCGELVFDDLGVPPAIYASETAAATRLDFSSLHKLLAPRRGAAHKGDFGHVLVVGGDHGMGGALQLAGTAALRVGAGLVSAATRESHCAAISAARPELMVHGVADSAALSALRQRATVIAIGPGLGQGAWARQLLGTVLDSRLPLVMDADALNLLALEPARRDNWILTPHPGEAARLLGGTSAEVQADRVAATRDIQSRFGGVVVLKGAGTVVVDAEGSVAICADGNPGMASGGMGDVLSGVIAGLLAQGLSLANAAQLGVCLHARAADEAAQAGQRGLLASDLFPVLRRLLG